ncbi:hypothetical protein MKZ38_003093 [Zalerion maritima]|uniref:Uncharacterized protein n=1 Tax=Zalerion maritima TaxID=339359 RepID=A0AAD5RYX7_9PEZI|nr:hypothetical protein MKZ38_003093 [Zalerion maritima]
MDAILSNPPLRQAFNLGILIGVAIHFAIIFALTIIYFLSLLLVRRINLSAMGINEKEFRTIYEVILQHRRLQQANLPKEGRRTL